jgi:uncharacterized membrane protein YeaQ/YmgE (transglycosylase-associated protein family)
MGIHAWIVIGRIAGFVAEQVTKTSMGLLMNLVNGVIGAVVGGFVFNLVGASGVTGFNIWSLLVAIVGAIILLLIVSMIRRNT